MYVCICMRLAGWFYVGKANGRVSEIGGIEQDWTGWSNVDPRFVRTGCILDSDQTTIE
jgi:hypothetical protein